MSKLGISIYPEHSTLEADKEYIALAAKYGFHTIFTCLLSVKDEETEEIKRSFKELNQFAHVHGMEILYDVAPSIFHKLHIQYDDLSFFHEIGADGIRLDEGFDGHTEARMTFNPYGLKIVINASQATKYLDNILSYQADRAALTACHNFYPQRYTGLGSSHFTRCNEALQAVRIPISCFVSSQNPDTFGPWPINEGLCTLEAHRNLPIDLQARHLFAMQSIDEVIVGNAYASEEELHSLSVLHPAKLTFRMTAGLMSDVEKEIVYTYAHFIRGDMSDYMLRSTMPRITYHDASIPPHDTRDVKRGDIVILNDAYGRYKGELHIILQDMRNQGDKNIVGTLSAQEQILLDYALPWRMFQLL